MIALLHRWASPSQLFAVSQRGIPGRDLATEYELDDTMTMVRSARLSSHAEVIVGARVSKSGSAMPQIGDFEGLSGVVRMDDAGLIEIVIDRTLS